MSPTPITILVDVRHAAPATCTTWDKQMWFSTWYKDKDSRTIEMSWIQIQTSPSQWLITINLRNWPLGFSISPWWVHWQQKIQSLNLRPHQAQLEDQNVKKSFRRWSRRRKSRKTNKMHEKWQTKPNWRRRAKKLKSTKSSQTQKYLPESTSPNTLNVSSPL
jgi:hypothetical protein